MELLKRYREEVEKDLFVNEFNIKEVQQRLPARKHFWVARLIDAKVEHQQLINQRRKLKSILVERVMKESPIRISKGEAETSIEFIDDVVNITQSIKEYEYIIEYLEKVEKIMSSMSYDLSNIIKINQSEQM